MCYNSLLYTVLSTVLCLSSLAVLAFCRSDYLTWQHRHLLGSTSGTETGVPNSEETASSSFLQQDLAQGCAYGGWAQCDLPMKDKHFELVLPGRPCIA